MIGNTSHRQTQTWINVFNMAFSTILSSLYFFPFLLFLLSHFISLYYLQISYFLLFSLFFLSFLIFTLHRGENNYAKIKKMFFSIRTLLNRTFKHCQFNHASPVRILVIPSFISSLNQILIDISLEINIFHYIIFKENQSFTFDIYILFPTYTTQSNVQQTESFLQLSSPIRIKSEDYC